MKPSKANLPDSSFTDAISIDADVIEFEELTPSEEEERRRLEEIVERSFVEAGRALRRLRDGKLYRSTHKTFSDYARDRFGFKRRHPYRLIDAASVFENLIEMCPTRTQNENLTNVPEDEFDEKSHSERVSPNRTQILPTSEYQIRPLTSLSPAQQKIAWQQAVSVADGKIPSHRTVKDVVQRIREKNPVPNPWRRGEIAEIVVKENPNLKGRGGYWCIITEVHQFSCTIGMWDTEYQVKISNLKTLDLPPDQQEEVRRLYERLNRLAQVENLDRSARVLLASLGRQTFLTPIEAQLLRTLESYYLKLT